MQSRKHRLLRLAAVTLTACSCLSCGASRLQTRLLSTLESRKQTELTELTDRTTHEQLTHDTTLEEWEIITLDTLVTDLAQLPIAGGERGKGDHERRRPAALTHLRYLRASHRSSTSRQDSTMRQTAVETQASAQLHHNAVAQTQRERTTARSIRYALLLLLAIAPLLCLLAYQLRRRSLR